MESAELRSLARVSSWRNLCWLGIDYLTAATILSITIGFFLQRESWGLSVAWNVPVGVIAVVLLGCVQHRIGLMGHEASHHLLHPNKHSNDLLAELLCFLPIFASMTHYRAKHLSHHLYPNDPERDSNLSGSRARRLYARFPMPRRSFIYHYYIKFFWPPFVLRNLVDLLRVITIGSGLSPIPGAGGTEKRPFYQNATIWGIGCLGLMIVANQSLAGRGASILLAAQGAVYLIGILGWRLVPNAWFERPGATLAHSARFSGLMRLTFIALLMTALGVSRELSGVWTGGFFLLLWVLPLIYVTPYLMLLREILQHANADTGKFTNSRVMYVDPFTRWALLGYGNDAHLVHHIYPNIPHYRLLKTHARLLERCPEYRAKAEETRGTFCAGQARNRSIAEALAAPRK